MDTHTGWQLVNKPVVLQGSTTTGMSCRRCRVSFQRCSTHDCRSDLTVSHTCVHAGWSAGGRKLHSGTQQHDPPDPVCSWGHRHHLPVVNAGTPSRVGGPRAASSCTDTCTPAGVLRCAAMAGCCNTSETVKNNGVGQQDSSCAALHRHVADAQTGQQCTYRPS